MRILFDWLQPANFMPHGHCYLWRPDVLWLHVGSDTLSNLLAPISNGVQVMQMSMGADRCSRWLACATSSHSHDESPPCARRR
jgi:hypothetical protein